MNSLVIRNGRVIDPVNDVDEVRDVWVVDGRITATAAKDAEVIDATGRIVSPGLIDMHVHLREPGRSDKETIETGTRCAARGGFTSVVCMPNTTPAADNTGTIAFIKQRAAEGASVHVFPTGAITKELKGEELAPIGSLKKAGVVAITDDGHCVQNNELMRRAVEYAKMFDLPPPGSLSGLQSGGGWRDERRPLERGARVARLARDWRGRDCGEKHSDCRASGLVYSLSARFLGAFGGTHPTGEEARRQDFR